MRSERNADGAGVDDRVPTGVEGIDEVLNGGLIPERTYMVRGEPGTGKSIFGLHFLTEGVAADETALYINLEESEEDVRQNARSLDLDLGDVEFLDLSPDVEFFTDDRSYDIFATDEVEGPGTVAEITDEVESLEPDRVFVDPITQLRYLTPDEYQFRKQVLSFMNFLNDHGATVVFTSQDTAATPDDDLQFLSDGTVHLGHTDEGRFLRVRKFRGSGFESGRHSMRVDVGGLRVFPSLVPRHHDRSFSAETVSSGIPALDELLHGGIERGTVTIVSGPSGVGKTTTGVQFMREAAGRGERSVVYTFEEGKETLLHRCEAIDIPVDQMRERGTLHVEEMEALQVSADEFAHRVRREVEAEDARIVMLDGVAGYRLTLQAPDEELTRKLHSLCRYLKNVGVTVILVNETPEVTGNFVVSEEGLSYLADNVLFMRYLELRGRMLKAIGVLKKRTSDFERSMREFQITEHGVKIGEPLTDLRGILTGTPTWLEDRERAPAPDEHRHDP